MKVNVDVVAEDQRHEISDMEINLSAEEWVNVLGGGDFTLERVSNSSVRVLLTLTTMGLTIAHVRDTITACDVDNQSWRTITVTQV